jgi:hypothetical protein
MTLRPPRTLEEGGRTAGRVSCIILNYIKYQWLTVMMGKY